MNVVFDIGESRHVKIIIHSIKNEPFEIVDASYTLTKKKMNTPECKGPAIINGHIIDMLISPQEKGEYVLEITYHIADETLIENVGVLVL